MVKWIILFSLILNKYCSKQDQGYHDQSHSKNYNFDESTVKGQSIFSNTNSIKFRQLQSNTQSTLQITSFTIPYFTTNQENLSTASNSDPLQNNTISFEQYLCFQDTNEPTILMKFTNLISDQQYRQLLLDLLTYSEQNITFNIHKSVTNYLTNTVYIGVINYTPLPLAIVQINFRNSSLNHQSKNLTFQFSPLVMFSQMTTTWAAQQIIQLREFSQNLDNIYVRILGFIGVFALIQNSPQEIIQLQFLNYTAPVNVYQFERALSYWVFDTSIPDWEVFPANPPFQLLNQYNIVNQQSDQNFALQRFSRIGLNNLFISNSQMILLTIGLAIMITLSSKLIQRKRITDINLEGLKKLTINQESVSLQQNSDIKSEVQELRDILISLLIKENKFHSMCKFILLQIFIEGKFCLITNSILLSIYQPYLSTQFSIISFTLSIALLLAYLVYNILQIYYLVNEFNKRIIMVKILNRHPDPIYKKLILEYDEYLESEYKYFLGNKKLSSEEQFFSTFIFLSKKWIYACILVTLYNYVVIQIYCLIVLHVFMIIFKLIYLPYKDLSQNLLTGLGDICFVIVLGFKYNDFNNTLIMQNNANPIYGNKWINDGWYTIGFELLFMSFYLLQFFIQMSASLINLNEQRNKDVRLRSYQNSLSILNKTYLAPQGTYVDVKFSKGYIRQHDMNESSNEKISFSLQQNGNMIFPLDQKIIQSIDMDEYWTQLQYQTYYWNEEISQNDQNYQKLFFYEMNSIGFYEQQSQYLRQGIILLKNFKVIYSFQRNNSMKYGQNVFEKSEFLQGFFYLSFQNNDQDPALHIHNVLANITYPYSKDVNFDVLEFDQRTNNYVYPIDFGKLNKELFTRQLKIQINSQVNGQNFNEVLLLSASELLMFQPLACHNQDEYKDYKLLHSQRIYVVESKVQTFLSLNFAKVHYSEQKQNYVIRMDFPQFSSLQVAYFDILIHLEKSAHDEMSILDLFIQKENLALMQELQSEREILEHYYSSLINYLIQ